MTDVLEDTLVFLDLDLDDVPKCANPDHPEVRATHRGIPPCGCNLLMCTQCALFWTAAKRMYPNNPLICTYCWKKSVVHLVVIEPLPM